VRLINTGTTDREGRLEEIRRGRRREEAEARLEEIRRGREEEEEEENQDWGVVRRGAAGNDWIGDIEAAGLESTPPATALPHWPRVWNGFKCLMGLYFKL